MTLDAGIVAPLGPLSDDALRFTLVNPPAGACTITWVSTVSPRAPDNAIEEVVPGTSVCPTLSRLDMTQTGKPALCCTPLPLREITLGVFEALLATVTLPVTFPAVAGAKFTVRVADCPAFNIVPAVTPLAVKSALLAVTLETVMLELPEFVNVTD